MPTPAPPEPATATPGGPGLWGPASPGRAFLIASLGILLAEVATFLLPTMRRPELALQVLVAELSTHLILSLPLIFIFFVRPLADSNRQRDQAQRDLQNLVEDLGATVQARAQELQATHQTLGEEVRLRSRADARNHLQTRLLEVVPQAIVATGKAGLIVFWNPTATTLFGWSEAEAMGQTLALVTSFPASAFQGGLSGLGGTSGWEGEILARRKDGLSFQADLTVSPMRRQDGSLAGFVYTFMDITQKRQAEDALRQSEEKYLTLVESAPTGIFITRKGTFLFVNQRLCDMLRMPRTTLEGVGRAESFVHPEDWPRIRGIWSARLSGAGPSVDSECRIITARKEVRWISGRTTVVNYGGEPALLGNIQDVTERHLAEEDLRASQQALHHLSARLMTAQEGERQRIAQELHDSIGQSLSAIKFMVERAMDVTCPMGREDHLAPLQAVVPVIQASVEEVRRISMALRPSTLDDLGLIATLAWFSREFQGIFPGIAVERRIQVVEAQVPESLKISMFRIVQEAMNNAAKHGEPERITLGLERLETCLRLTVADDGVGFDVGAKRVLDGDGGYGLVSMRERAELGGGTLQVASAPGQGTRVVAEWPMPALD